MAATAYAAAAPPFGIALPKVRTARRPSILGDLVLVAFLLVQCLDGVFTYVGVSAFGMGIEANPIVAGLMTHLGHGPGLLSAKIIASFLGICLHLRKVHAAVLLLTGFYLAAAIAPWTMILFF
jgi:hypothetical protein